MDLEESKINNTMDLLYTEHLDLHHPNHWILETKIIPAAIRDLDIGWWCHPAAATTERNVLSCRCRTRSYLLAMHSN